MIRLDVHQHLWTEPLVEALERRRRLPFIRRDGELYVVHVAGEQPTVIDPDSERASRRAALLDRDGLDCALIAISSPLGIEALPREEASELIEAHLAGVLALGGRFGAWGPLPLEGADPRDVDDVLGRGCVGVSLPAGALAPPDALDALHPMLARLEASEAPLFVHPGPGLGGHVPATSLRDPLWWPALTDYVAQMQAAWLSFMTNARRAYPRLRAVFAMLAGGAPLLSERLVARGGPSLEVASGVNFYDTSSYGPFAITAMASRVGRTQLLLGSDRPVAEPTPSDFDGVLHRNGAWLAPRVAVPA